MSASSRKPDAIYWLPLESLGSWEMLPNGNFEDAPPLSNVLESLMTSLTGLNKSAIRKIIQDQRLALSAQQRIQKARALQQHVFPLNAFRQSHRVAFYWPFQGEIDPIPLLNIALKLGKHCYLPVLHPSKHKELLFVEYRTGDPLRVNRYGIKEPYLGHRPPLPPHFLNLVFVPLLAFNPEGRRLGKGGGYYDKTFAFLEKQPQATHPQLIGLAYDFQKIDALPYEKWDLSLTGVVTETGFLSCIKVN